jgi:hypothetical protein
MSLGEAAFDAREGGVLSEDALQSPLSSAVSISYPSFAHPKLRNTLVDTHFSQRGREGRMMAFLARFLVEKEKGEVVGMGLDEGAALVLDDKGFRVFGPQGVRVWMYRVTGPAFLAEGEPLGLLGIRRVELEPGSQGAWPLDFEAYGGQELQVSEGVVQVLAGTSQ